eukprot:5314026-Alexandrium_andersonii.AAC.1
MCHLRILKLWNPEADLIFRSLRALLVVLLALVGVVVLLLPDLALQLGLRLPLVALRLALVLLAGLLLAGAGPRLLSLLGGVQGPGALDLIGDGPLDVQELQPLGHGVHADPGSAHL